MLSENLQRKDLSEVEKADTLKEILSSRTTEVSLRDIGKKLGVHFDYVRHLLNLAGYPTEVKQMVKSEELSAKSVRPLAQLQTPQEQIKVAEHIRDNGLNYDKAKEVVDKIKELPPEVREVFISEPEVTVEEGEIYQHLCTACSNSQKSIYESLGVSERRFYYVINAYTKLSSEVQTMVQQKQITEESTRALTKQKKLDDFLKLYKNLLLFSPFCAIYSEEYFRTDHKKKLSMVYYSFLRC